ncbi:MAG: protein jag, partial [Clostridia bacterium]|nr:protein jag [Clostridia bacterium]
TVEAAIEAGLKELNANKEDVVITVLDEGVKGVLGIGGKKAKVKIEIKKTDAERVVTFLDGLFDILGIIASSKIEEDGEKIIINVISDKSSALIGYRGEMLDSIQTLAGAVANIGNEEYKRVVVDCENYRSKREETLKNLAIRLANKAIKQQRQVSLEPMNPFERRIIHSALSNFEHVKTESQGVEPKRYIVIIPDNAKPYSYKDGKTSYGKSSKSGFKSEMIKTTQKTAGFGTFLGNSLKKD